MGISGTNLAEKLCDVKHEIIDQTLNECSAMLCSIPGATPRWFWAESDDLRCNVTGISLENLKRRLSALHNRTRIYCDQKTAKVEG